MNRRGFVGAALAGAGSFFLPQKSKAGQWWDERDFVLDDVPGTEFLWPRDRIIHMAEPDRAEDGRRQAMLIPTFSILTIGGVIEDQMRAAIVLQKEQDGEKYCGSHIHLFRVRGMPDQYGILMFSKKCHPVVDCWEDSHITERILLERRRERLSSDKENER